MFTAKSVIPVMAEAEDTPPFPAHGLPKLVDESVKLLPKLIEDAFVAAQQIDLEVKREKSIKIAVAASTSAAAMAFVPVPFAGTAGLLTINAGMVTAIAAAMGVVMDRTAMLALAVSLAGSLAASVGGRMLLGEALKFVPGVGTAAGTAVEASVAGATTYGLGVGLIEFLLWFHKSHARMPEGDEIKNGFSTFWTDRPNKEMRPPEPTLQ